MELILQHVRFALYGFLYIRYIKIRYKYYMKTNNTLLSDWFYHRTIDLM